MRLSLAEAFATAGMTAFAGVVAASGPDGRIVEYASGDADREAHRPSRRLTPVVE